MAKLDARWADQLYRRKEMKPKRRHPSALEIEERIWKNEARNAKRNLARARYDLSVAQQREAGKLRPAPLQVVSGGRIESNRRKH